MWHAALGTNPRYLRPLVWEKYYGLTLDDLDCLSDKIGDVLHGSVLTREELMQKVLAFGKKIPFSSWGTVLKPAAFTGRLCFGPSVGQRVRFTHPRSWLSLERDVEPEAATAEVARRYLKTYGPATFRDLARWWGGGGIAGARQWIAALGDEVARVEVEGVESWMMAADLRRLRGIEPVKCVRLLPGFDQYVVVASCHAEQLLPEGLRSKVYRPQGWISPVLLVNGRMEGTWRHQLRGKFVEVAVEPFGRMPAWVRRGVEEEAERLAVFLGRKLRIV
jgi:hypothetical protein